MQPDQFRLLHADLDELRALVACRKALTDSGGKDSFRILGQLKNNFAVTFSLLASQFWLTINLSEL
jgi:hypothetical protein